MKVMKKHIDKPLSVVQQCASSIRICYNSDYLQIKGNIFGSNWSIGLLMQSLMYFLVKGD